MELMRALATLCEPGAEEHAAVARALGLPEPPDAAAYTECFVFQLYPYASVYLGDEGMLGGEARDRIAGFWRALGMTPPAESDHLAVMLSMLASLDDACHKEADPIRRDALVSAKRAYVWEHLASWLPAYLDRVEEVGAPFYRAWAAMLADVVDRERAEVGDRHELPLHFREATPFPGPECAMRELLAALLAPARSGMILVRDDLRRAARELGLGSRLGERRFVLKALFEQDAARTLEWLGREAARQADRHARRPDPLARDWERRAREASDELGRLASIARQSGSMTAAMKA